MSLPNKLRIELLARPNSRNVTQKYDPVEADKVKHYCKPIKHPIKPIHNRRLDMLAEPSPFKVTKKYEEADLPSTCVSRAVMEATCTARLDHLSKPSPRMLRALKEDRRYLGKEYLEYMNEKIAIAMSTIYYHNVQSKINIQKDKDKKSKKVIPKPKCWDDCGDRDRMEKMAKPKEPPKPRPTRKRKHRKLALLLPRIEVLSLPTTVAKKPDKQGDQVSPAALQYVATERIRELTKQAAWKLVKPWEPTGVTEAAKHYQITDRVNKLAEPRARAHAVERDFKENAYEISPAALKYKITPRVTELAQPRVKS